ncbi:DNA (cytosine-5-)-methyltransferase [Desulforegula conservatrix]|uniref:DNA (cytosine-5-)-methyltransferase n=1 Tax=Desulforegula conservatrix TaxID=153026 RepID=UPI00041A189F|nr:DNA (cytosine-5-)-methyltransferase [Desulforegula conservatrix]
MRHLDLFSGIGGFALAASWAWPDHKIVSFCEIDPFCQKVLKKHWPDVPVHTDIKTLKGDSFGSVDLISGGFPCQPYSVAGKQRGSEDDRALWPEMLRIIKEAKPRWVIGENVAGLIKMELDQVLSDLESIGYETQAFVIPACAVNAPHRRDRVWIIGHSDCNRKSDGPFNAKKMAVVQSIVTNSPMCRWDERASTISGEDKKTKGKIRGCNCHADNANPNSSRFEKFNTPTIAERQGLSTRFSVDAWTNWPTQSPVCGRDDGISNRVDRLKSLGNAIVPQVAVQIMQAIKDMETA